MPYYRAFKEIKDPAIPADLLWHVVLPYLIEPCEVPEWEPYSTGLYISDREVLKNRNKCLDELREVVRLRQMTYWQRLTEDLGDGLESTADFFEKIGTSSEDALTSVGNFFQDLYYSLVENVIERVGKAFTGFLIWWR